MMDVDTALAWVANWNGTRNGSSYEGEVHRALATEVRRLRNERDAALNLLEGYAPDLTQRLRDQMAFDREEGRA